MSTAFRESAQAQVLGPESGCEGSGVVRGRHIAKTTEPETPPKRRSAVGLAMNRFFETRERAVRACEQARLARDRAEEAIRRSVRVRSRSMELLGRATPRIEGQPSCRRFLVRVGRMYIDDLVLQRDDVFTEAVLGGQAECLTERGMIVEVDYDLSQLKGLGNPWDDGRWMG